MRPKRPALTADLRANGAKVTFTFDAANEMLSQVQPMGQRTTYSYDAAGNQASKLASAEGSVTYTWNADGRLAQASFFIPEELGEPITAPTTFTYNGDGLLHSHESFSSNPRYYVWDGQNVLCQVNDEGNLRERYTHEPRAYGHLLSEYSPSSEESQYYHFDAQGSTMAITAANEQVDNRFVYNAYGSLVHVDDLSGPGGTFGWLGRLGYHRYSLYFGADERAYVRARHYDPNTARWLARDPLRYRAGDPNLYRYAGNRVVVKVDPSGRQAGCGLQGNFVGDTGEYKPYGRYQYDIIGMAESKWYVQICASETTFVCLQGLCPAGSYGTFTHIGWDFWYDAPGDDNPFKVGSPAADSHHADIAGICNGLVARNMLGTSCCSFGIWAYTGKCTFYEASGKVMLMEHVGFVEEYRLEGVPCEGDPPPGEVVDEVWSKAKEEYTLALQQPCIEIELLAAGSFSISPGGGCSIIAKGEPAKINYTPV